jgi:hypothetical protein
MSDKQITLTVTQQEYEVLLAEVHKRESAEGKIVSLAQVCRDYLSEGLYKDGHYDNQHNHCED